MDGELARQLMACDGLVACEGSVFVRMRWLTRFAQGQLAVRGGKQEG